MLATSTPPAPAAQSSRFFRSLEETNVGRNALRAVEETYSPAFSAYLARFLINWEPSTVKWWEQQRAIASSFEYANEDGIVGILGDERYDYYLATQFSSLVTSVEVGLQAFADDGGGKRKNNATRLAQTLERRFTSTSQKRALAQLLSLIRAEDQPTSRIAALIGEADNAKATRIVLDAPGTGLNATPPEVKVSRPPTSSGRRARARALIRPTGRWRAVRIIDGGSGFREDGPAPTISIPKPLVGNGTMPVLQPTVKNGVLKGLTLVDGGSGYYVERASASNRSSSIAATSATDANQTSSSSNQTSMPKQILAPLIVTISPSPATPTKRTASITSTTSNGSSVIDFTGEKLARTGLARPARAELLPEYSIYAIELLDAGSGYNADDPPLLTITAPPESTAFSSSTAKARVELTQRQNSTSKEELKSLTQQLARAADERYAMSSYRYVGPATPDAKMAAGIGLPLPQLLPPMVVPVLNDPNKSLTTLPTAKTKRAAFELPIRVPDGAFGRSAPLPIEEKVALQPSAALKIFIAGGLCSSTAHSALVPLDVVKTRMQTEPQVYNKGPLDTYKRLLEAEGSSAFVQGAGATALGYFIAGSLSFGLLEVFSRQATTIAGPGNALFFGTPLLAISSVFATALCATAVCPFEAVRILSVRTGEPSYTVLQNQIQTEGFSSLYRGLPPILLKEVPFVVTKFVIFDQVSGFASRSLPEGTPTYFVATIVPLLCGAIAGLCATIASQPADVVLTRTNEEGATLGSSVSDVASQPSLVLQGLAPRLIFGVLLTSLQFLFYGQLRGLFGVSKADLTLVWDVLGSLRLDGGQGLAP